MASVYRSSSSNWIFPLKVLLISASVCLLGVVFKLSLPVISDFLLSQLPLLWISLRSWFTPPYLYVVINGIIITIAASSRFHHRVEEQPELAVPVPVKADIRSDFSVAEVYDAVVLKNPVNVPQQFDYDVVAASKIPVDSTLTVYGGLESPVVCGQNEVSVTDFRNPALSSSEVDEDDAFVISRSSWMPPARELSEIPAYYSFETEKPPASARFGHRRNVKSSPEAGRALGVAKSKRNDTLESTWKTITDGRPIPLARHLKKCETWETVGRHSSNNDSNSGPPEASPVKMKKHETFKDRNSNNSSLSPSPGSGKLRKEPSLSQDELNRRVEAFIKKFNEEMRLQRQESLNQYNEMINRGAGP
ncbi:uncharacterized protein LOC122083538 [Macadamia integrifolia]|uniref:uncharacterized protein LOC122083538 n=1 Tax=Macadamia integrifolia TaxID=60698 RepID=UPI001C4F8DEE|nr:uncharacterized protein LOC122083538 [Macadamia integrifolia]